MFCSVQRDDFSERELNNFTITHPETSNKYNLLNNCFHDVHESKQLTTFHETEQYNINMAELENRDSYEGSEVESEPFQDSGSEYVISKSEESRGSSDSNISSENEQEETILEKRKRLRKKVNSSNWERNKNKLKE